MEAQSTINQNTNLQDISAVQAGSNRLFRLVILFAAGLLLTISRRTAVGQIYSLWRGSEDFDGLYLVPILTLIVLWQRRKELLSFQWKTFWAAVIPLGIILVFQAFEAPTGARMQVLLLITSIELIILTILGLATFKYITAPLMLSVLAIPAPDWLWQEITLITQYLSLKASIFVYSQAAPISYEGFWIFLHTCQKWVVVSPQCSGIRSMLGLCIVSWFLFLRIRLRTAAILPLALSVPLIALSLNVCRILLTLTLRDHGLEKYTLDFWHGLTGIIVFLAGFFIVSRLAAIVEIKNHSTSPRRYARQQR